MSGMVLLLYWTDMIKKNTKREILAENVNMTWEFQ
jgi:hypothetical protein